MIINKSYKLKKIKYACKSCGKEITIETDIDNNNQSAMEKKKLCYSCNENLEVK